MKQYYQSTKKLHLLISLILLTFSLIFTYILSRNSALKQVSINKLTQSEQNLRKANITKDTFISILAHDLKNPIASIMGYSQFILESFQTISKEDLKNYLEVICKSSSNLADLIDDILAWARSQSGKIRREPQIINLNEIIWEAIRTIEAQASQKGIDIIVSGKRNIEVYADPKMLKNRYS